jgi:hypothetical protein
MRTRLAALLLGLTCLTAGPAAATPYDDLPVGAPTTLPWWQHGRLHVGDTVIETKRNDIASRNGTTVVGSDADRRGGQPTTWSLVRGDRLAPLPMRAKADQPLISADGHWVAWLEVRAPRTDAYKRIERYRVVLYDARAHRVANTLRDRRLVAWEDGGNGIWIRTLSDSGRLLLTQGNDGVKVLSPRGVPVDFGGPGGSGLSVDGWPLGTTTFRGHSSRSVYGTVSRAGRFDEAGSFALSFAGLWSADGSGYAYEHDGAYAVRTLDGATVALDVPEDVDGLRVVGWESDTSVVLWSFDDWTAEMTSRLVRCSTTSGACEQVPDGPRSGRFATMASRY